MKYFEQIRKCKGNLLELERRIKTQIQIENYKMLALTSMASGVNSNLYCDKPIIVSLTSYGLRVNEVYLAIESLMQQTMRPNRIILWLSNDFNKPQRIPNILYKQVERGLEIKFCDDIYSYKKLIPALREFADSVIITADDDTIYPIDFVELLLKAYLNNPSHIYCNYGYQMSVSKTKEPESYDKWVKHIAKGSSLYNLPTGVDGILYPPGCFYEDVLNEELFLELCPYADDLWFKCMSMLRGVEVEVISRLNNPRKEFVYIDSAASISLSRINRDKKLNDVQARKLFQKYHLGDLFV